jgi:hypothetical protein
MLAGEPCDGASARPLAGPPTLPRIVIGGWEDEDEEFSEQNRGMGADAPDKRAGSAGKGSASGLFGSEPNYSAVLSPCPELNHACH